MCGIAGYSVRPRSTLHRTLAAQALLAAIAERGADAVGYAYRAPSDTYSTVVKQRTPASRLLDRVDVPPAANQLLAHVRDYTKGHPSIAANNHPVRHGPVVGIHNGIIVNDEALLESLECARSEPSMTVDSEAIFAIAAHSLNDARALEELRGAMAAAWLDEREPGVLYVARGSGRPLWVGEGRDGVFFGSTRLSLEIVEQYCGVKLRKRAAREGTLLQLVDGEVARRERFRHDREYVEPNPLPSVRAPGERDFCLSRLASIAAAA
jgi:glucosamine 6-phosphate synthetase-like amidotransferase/phosphosugar isomerase protein